MFAIIESTPESESYVAETLFDRDRLSPDQQLRAVDRFPKLINQVSDDVKTLHMKHYVEKHLELIYYLARHRTKLHRLLTEDRKKRNHDDTSGDDTSGDDDTSRA